METPLLCVEGTIESVSDAVELENALYIIEFEFIAKGKDVELGFHFEDLLDEGNTHYTRVRYKATEKDKIYVGRKTIRIEKGKYLLSIVPQYASDWKVRLFRPEAQ